MELKSTSSASGLGLGSSPVTTDEEAGVVIVVPDEKLEMLGALTNSKETSVGGVPPISSQSANDEDLPGITLTKKPH
ncbi:hypothetical protein MMC31_006436, partial [Peltigera leucophlebia]|nr:hypothetical protein [Peltigera leucophlebia]